MLRQDNVRAVHTNRAHGWSSFEAVHSTLLLWGFASLANTSQSTAALRTICSPSRRTCARRSTIARRCRSSQHSLNRQNEFEASRAASASDRRSARLVSLDLAFDSHPFGAVARSRVRVVSLSAVHFASVAHLRSVSPCNSTNCLKLSGFSRTGNGGARNHCATERPRRTIARSHESQSYRYRYKRA